MESLTDTIPDELKHLFVNASMVNFWMDRIIIEPEDEEGYIGIPTSVYSNQWATWADLLWGLQRRVFEYPGHAFFINGKCVYAGNLSPSAIRHWQRRWRTPPGIEAVMDESGSM